jgi:hypothetical protein
MIKEGESSLSVSGVFSSRIQVATTGAVQLEPADFWAEIMNVSETIAYCCPRYVGTYIHTQLSRLTIEVIT